MTTRYRKKLIEVALPLAAINAACAREKSIRHGHPSTLHLWWARRPLAAARAVLFAQLVDDPSAWPELFPTDKAQDEERQRLFRLIEALVLWENSHQKQVIDAARLEIARSHARSSHSPEAEAILAEDVEARAVDAYLATELPSVHDPFAGGGTIALEAQRLGLRAVASDLNPVAVLIDKALIEIPPRFAGMPPVNPQSRRKAASHTWRGAQGLAADVRYYATWMREEAKNRIGHLYPGVEITPEMTRDRADLNGLEGQKLTVIAWLWTRTVASPNPALKGMHVPLISNFWLSTKQGKKTWIEPVVASDGKSYRFEIRTGTPKDDSAVAAGTKLGRGAHFRCVLSGAPIEPDYIRSEGLANRIGIRLMAVVAKGRRRRIYLPPDDEMERVAKRAQPEWKPEQALPNNPRWFSPPDYGMLTYADLFTPRQLVTLAAFSDLVSKARDLATADAEAAGLPCSGKAFSDGGRGARAYGDAVATMLGLCASKLADAQSSLVHWKAGRDRVITTFARQALPMVWDFAESNAFAGGSGDFALAAHNMMRVVDAQVLSCPPGLAAQADAVRPIAALDSVITSTDPPYYDNIGYADLSDFFYLWLRRTLREVYPDLLATLLVPKAQELVATPYRHGGREKAEAFFSEGMTRALGQLAQRASPAAPTTIYYAFKQSETGEEGTSSTGWKAFLDAVVAAGFSIGATWPIRTERSGRSIEIGTNALASSIVLVCRRRARDAGTIPRGELRRALRAELPGALKALQHGHMAPVDLAQASIGPAMAIFSRYAKVIEAGGSAMTIRSALQLINEALDEYLEEQEGELDAGSRFAVTWYETHAWDCGSYGDAETLAKARNVSVAGVAEAGILHSAAGKVRLVKRSELPADWNASGGGHLPVWKATQHLIKCLEAQGEQAAAQLLKQLGPLADSARDLAYRLYNTCERRGWAEEARAYNGLVIAWPELEKLGAGMAAERPPAQLGLGIDTGPAKSSKPAVKGRKRKAKSS